MPPPFAESQALARGQPTYLSQKAKLETRGPWVLTGLSMKLFLIIADLRRPIARGVARCILMSINTQLLEQAAKLSVNERIELVEAIWDTVHESQNELPLTAAQVALLEQHLAAYRENPKAGSPWEEVRARLERLT